MLIPCVDYLYGKCCHSSSYLCDASWTEDFPCWPEKQLSYYDKIYRTELHLGTRQLVTEVCVLTAGTSRKLTLLKTQMTLEVDSPSVLLPQGTVQPALTLAAILGNRIRRHSHTVPRLMTHIHLKTIHMYCFKQHDVW